MSKQSEAKEMLGYSTKSRCCMNCVNYSAEQQEREGVFGRKYVVEKNRRCTLGKFAVQKMASCNQWKRQTI